MLYEIVTAVVLLIIFVIVMVVMHNKITAVENQSTQAIRVQNKNFAKIVETEHKALNVLRAEDVKFTTSIELLKKEDQAFSDKYAKFEKDQDKRFVDMEGSVNRRFVDSERSVNRRFVDMEGSVNRRFVDMEGSVNRRFVDMERSVNIIDNNASRDFYYIRYMILDMLFWVIDFMLLIFATIFDLSTTVQELQNNYASLSQKVDTESVTIGKSWKLNANNNTMNIDNNNNSAIKIMNDRLCIQNVCVSAEDLKTIRSKNGL